MGPAAQRAAANEPAFERYRPWLRAAAVYNLVWGSSTVIVPTFPFHALGLPAPEPPAIWQVVGMFVLLYAPAYWWASEDPYRHRHLVLLGLAGKTLGPLGYAWAVASGGLPVEFGWIILTNDLLWWPMLATCVRAASQRAGGWGALIRGR